MSVSRTDYLIYGVELDFKSMDFDDFESEICGESDRKFDMLYDGMCGKFVFAGKILARSKEYEGFDVTKIDMDLIGKDSQFIAPQKENCQCFSMTDEFLENHICINKLVDCDNQAVDKTILTIAKSRTTRRKYRCNGGNLSLWR